MRVAAIGCCLLNGVAISGGVWCLMLRCAAVRCLLVVVCRCVSALRAVVRFIALSSVVLCLFVVVVNCCWCCLQLLLMWPLYGGVGCFCSLCLCVAVGCLWLCDVCCFMLVVVCLFVGCCNCCLLVSLDVRCCCC